MRRICARILPHNPILGPPPGTRTARQAADALATGSDALPAGQPRPLPPGTLPLRQAPGPPTPPPGRPPPTPTLQHTGTKPSTPDLGIRPATAANRPPPEPATAARRLIRRCQHTATAIPIPP